MMDLQTGLLCIAFAFISSIVIYIILSVSSIKEDSFEEAKANRRKMMKQFQDENKLSHEKSKEKKIKKINKKTKEKKDNIDGTETENKSSTVEVDNGKKLDQASSSKENVKSAASTSDHKDEIVTSKIKENKKKVHNPAEDQHHSQQNDTSENSNVSHKSSNTVTVPVEKVAVAKEKKEKKKDTENDKPNDNQESSANDTAVNNANNEETLKIIGQSQTSQNLANRPAVSSAKPSKKKRTEITSINQLKNEKEAVSINLLLSLLKKAELSRSEIQMLIDALLNKQHDDVSEWLKGRQDPIVKLKKQLADGEQVLKDEKSLNASLQNKLRDLRAELANDRLVTRYAEEQVGTLQAEIRTLTHKLHTITDEKHAVNLNIQQLQKQLNDEQKMIMKLKEEQALKLRITEEQSHEAVRTVQSQVAQLSGQLQEKMRIIEEFREMHAEMTRAFDGAQFEVKELQSKLKTQERALSESKSEIETLLVTKKNLYEQNEHLSNQLNNQCQEMSVLREKNESLTKINAENWENGFSYNKKQGMAELEARLEERNNQLEQLTKELEFKNTKIQELNHNLMRNKNESAKTQMLLDKANAEISLLKEKVNEANKSIQEDVIGQLKSSLNERNKEVSLLKNEIELCKQRNNTLRNKNWKIVEALKKAEKALQIKLRNEQNFNEHKTCVNAESMVSLDVQKIHGTISRLIKHLYPDVDIAENKESLDDWLTSLEDVIMSRTLNGTDNPLSVPDLQAHNNHLQALVVHYKGIITDTERMLNQLQKHVEVEEARWKGKIKSLEEEIAKLRSNRGTDIFLHP